MSWLRFASLKQALCVLIIDACRLKTVRDAGLFGQQTAELARREGVVVFFGASPGEACQELPKFGHGIFTYSLISVVRGLSEATPLEIDRRVGAQVSGICAEHKLAPQHPYTSLAPIQKAVVDIFSGNHVPTSGQGARRCILIVGPANSGKTTLGQYVARKLGCLHVEMSSFAWRRLQEASFEGSIQDFMEDAVWPHDGKNAIAQDLISSHPGVDKVVICGPRTVEEIETLRAQNWNCETVYLFANARKRYDRYVASGKRDRFGVGYREFVERDLRELSWGLAKASTMSNIGIFVNEDTVEDMFRNIATKILSLRMVDTAMSP